MVVLCYSGHEVREVFRKQLYLTTAACAHPTLILGVSLTPQRCCKVADFVNDMP